MRAQREREREKRSLGNARNDTSSSKRRPIVCKSWMFTENRADSFVGRELRRFVGINYEYLAKSGGEEKRVSRRSSSS